MPTNSIGQMITFSVDQTSDETFSKYVFIKAKKNDTIAAIAARRGHPEQAKTILNLNKNVKGIHNTRIRKTTDRLKAGTKIKLPGTLKPGDVIHVLADDPPPIVKDGYAMYDIVNVPGQRGIERFLGSNPVSLDVPIQWEAYTWGDGTGNEAEIAKLNKMAGIGVTKSSGGMGARIGPPAVIRVSVTDNYGNVVPLIPAPFQWMPGSNAPEYRITGLSWDANPLRTDNKGKTPGGRRTRQKAVVTITEYTPIQIAEASATARSIKKNAKTTAKAKAA